MRLDAALPALGLARSRTHAARLIADGLVTVDGRGVVKASFRVMPGSVVEVAGSDAYVSRGAHKLIGALDAFPGVAVAGRLALDVGASTGGFTQVLLERGARRVVALDVGHGQLDPLIREDPRVDVVEGFNVRDLTPESLAGVTPADLAGERPGLVVGDLSFISLGLVLPAIACTAADGADVVLLIKPQFEVGRTGIREGIVHDPGLRDDAVMRVLWAAWDLGLGTAGLVSSPIVGGAGNHEYLAWFSGRAGSNPTQWRSTSNEITGA
ncbi:TlyA family RNA methyltransferase [Clavibacter michiganensis]|uniref:TlyA family RNA methyltransferase n=1 Tax=Clavibacter michiganensis TaxID=28447 RepID=UPI0005BD4507|nr:TlyA family RNA methyltransferase [Clavibacter michiganensis]MDO4019116.1 TlyA family RNA methyltransferase [Clavibacter michiganensis]MDO4038925.1 TlyA family RNA methyltransferase [Clavibacter michiganensis]MDO4041909.1 TlyA family RNA methyltransferase [Clavibacter michiganensis]MDO4043251.1 TlyA family RNA methyltransferase [Clavibacter michiganensis]MDO4050345.1 TlyA family RNA methyltransferase [Clavibacter michiganensis]